MDAVEIFLRGCVSRFTGYGWAGFPAGTIYRSRVSLWELLLITQGGMRWKIGTQEHAVGAGAMCLVPGGQRELRRWTTDGPSRQAYLHFRVRADAARALAKLAPPLVRSADTCAEARSVFRRLLERIAAPGFSAEVARAELRLVLALYLCPEPRVPLPLRRSMPRIANAVRALQTIWAREGIALIPLARWAAALGYSREHLCRVIRGELGCTPREFMQALRCNQAIHLLQASNLRVKQIAIKLGFNSATHLARLLRRNYGMAPSGLRRLAGPHDLPPSRLPLPLEEGLSLFWDPEILRLE